MPILALFYHCHQHPNIINTSIRTLDHQIFSKGQWNKAIITAHPQVTINLAQDKRPSKVVMVPAAADTGSHSNLWLLDKLIKAGFHMSNLSPVSISLNATNRSSIQIDGAFHAITEGRSHADELIVCHSMIYVSHDVTIIYLSYGTMVAFGIVNYDFPVVNQSAYQPISRPARNHHLRPTT